MDSDRVSHITPVKILRGKLLCLLSIEEKVVDVVYRPDQSSLLAV